MARRKSITREQILNAAYQLVLAEGFSKFTARNVASRMKCSTQPIYLEFDNMDDLREQVMLKIQTYLLDNIFSKVITGNVLHDLVLNYVQFAEENRTLYRTLYVEEYIDAKELNDFNRTLFMSHMNQDEVFEKLTVEQKENCFITSWVMATGIATLNASGMYNPTQEDIIVLVNRSKDNAITYEGILTNC